MTVLVTGANGFVGQAVCRALVAAGQPVLGAARQQVALPDGAARRPSPSLAPDADWSQALRGAKAVVHLAARVHVMHDAAHDPLAEFRSANRDGTLALARQAAAQGVGHFVFMSSIKAAGEESLGRPLGPDDQGACDPYGISKLEAEQALRALSDETGMAITVLRPPLVYGPGVKGNFRSLIKLVDRGLPLPLACVANRRALIGVGNLADAVRAALAAPGGFRILTPSDAECLSTPDLVRRLAAALGRPARLVPVPVGLMRLAGAVTGKSAAVQRLTQSLEVDKSCMETMGWAPPFTLDQGLAEIARWWRNKERNA
jgi:nucleoside-diphosphate-sugar epimerase